METVVCPLSSIRWVGARVPLGWNVRVCRQFSINNFKNWKNKRSWFSTFLPFQATKTAKFQVKLGTLIEQIKGLEIVTIWQALQYTGISPHLQVINTGKKRTRRLKYSCCRNCKNEYIYAERWLVSIFRIIFRLFKSSNFYSFAVKISISSEASV